MSVSKPSDEAYPSSHDIKLDTSSDGIVIGNITFATEQELQYSLKESYRKTEIYTLSERLSNIEKMTPIPKLTSSNWAHWYETLQRFIRISDTAAVFLKDPPNNKATTMWYIWWAAKLREIAPHVTTAPRDSPHTILSNIVSISQAAEHNNLTKVADRFFSYQPSNKITLHKFINEYQRRFTDLREHFPVTKSVLHILKYSLLHHLQIIQPDLAQKCRNFSLTEIISECQSYASPNKPTDPTTNIEKCNFCKNKGHSENECRKKKRAESSNMSKNNSVNKSILSIDKTSVHTGFQLDSAADCHVSGNISDFSSYSPTPHTVRVARGTLVRTSGSGNLIFPTSDNKTEILQGAIHMPGQTTRILSVAQLEKQGFSIRWPSDYRDVELLHPNGNVCATFRRISGRFISVPHSPNQAQSVFNVQRDWHGILGHPGRKAQDAALKSAGINKYKPPTNCDICTKVKITKIKGQGSLRKSSSFAESIHMDLVGGQKSLSTTTFDKSVPNATWFLLAVDEFTSWKWAWPIYAKKTVPNQIRYLLEHLKTKFDKTPKFIHTDLGTEFNNTELKELLLSRGIDWQKSSSHAPEQNGIVERNVRTVTEKMRALHLQSGLPLRLWPLILTAAINILNITPNNVSPNSSNHAVFQKLPDINHSHPFGCRAFWLEPDQNKLESKAKSGIYVGTEFTGGHLILNPETNRTVVRRDVRFNETTFPLKTQILALQNSNRRIIESALSGPKAKLWAQAMDNEIDNMERNKVWTLVPRSEAMGKIMTGKWTLKEKSSGQLKARWCARGFSEPFADDTYADVLPPSTMRRLLALAASKDLHIRHVDITAAFLHAELDNPIYIEQSNGREKPGNKICKLHKAIYGLKTAPRRWQNKLRQVLFQLKFVALKFDNNVFRRNNTIISTYVDDFMIISQSETEITDTINALAEAFDVKDLGNMTKFIGINIERKSNGIYINQTDKIEALCDDMGMSYCKGAYTPIADDNLIDHNTEDLTNDVDAKIYRSTVGSLLHIANMTRPDIQYAVNRLCRYVRNPSQNTMLALKNLVRYLSHTKSASLLFSRNNNAKLTASSDSSWGNIISSKGTSGVMFFVNDTPIVWWSNKQTVTAQSTCEAEYAALTKLATAAKWIKPLYEEIFQAKSTPVLTEIDNMAAMITANSNKTSARNRHFLMKEATVRETIRDKIIELKYTPTESCRSDGLTKALQRHKHDNFCNQLKLYQNHSDSRGV